VRELEERTVCIDLDFTLCTHEGDYTLAQPVEGAQEALRALREAGWVIVVQTARHFNHWKTTVDWLAHHDLVYDQLVFGKPPARVYVDDRAIRFDGDWVRMVQQLEAIRREGGPLPPAPSTSDGA